MNVEDRSSIFEIGTSDYVLGFWYLAGAGKDYIAVVHRPEGEACYRARYRFRYYAGTRDPFDGMDKKITNGGPIPIETSEEAIIQANDRVLDQLIASGFCPSKLPWKLRDRRFKRIVRDTGRKYYELLLTMPFAHVKVLPRRGAPS